MNEGRFVTEREPAWRELAGLLERARVGNLAGLSGLEVRRLAALYRSATTDLATARTLKLSAGVQDRLNHLCAVAHGVVYSGGRPRRASRFTAVLAHDFPRAVRATLGWHVFAFGLFVVGAAASYAILRAHPDLVDREFGPVFRDRAQRAAALPEGERRYLELRSAFSPFLSWGLIVNNVVVSILGFGAGVGGVVPGVLIVLFNGVMIGAGVAAFAEQGVADVILSFIVAHGPMELAAIFLATGVGMHVGASWILPGRRARGAALASAANQALSVLVGVVFLLILAGIIEGHLSPSGAPVFVKAAVGAITFAATIAWIALGGRGEPATPRSAP